MHKNPAVVFRSAFDSPIRKFKIENIHIPREITVTALLLFALLAFSGNGRAAEQDKPESDRIVSAPDAVPDIREEESKLKLQKSNFVVVPIPISNPTLDTGLVLGAAYFYPQTEQQAAKQPASVTMGAGFYTSNKSNGFVVGHQSYLAENKWRVGGVFGYADLRLRLRTTDTVEENVGFNWLIKGNFVAARVSRKIAGNWYAGLLGRDIRFDQSFELEQSISNFDTGEETRATGLGVVITKDNRDKPLNSYTGSILEFQVLFNDTALGGDTSYQTAKASYRSYHSITPSTVLAWELEGCKQSSGAPLWDSCRLGLRGFATTDYLGKSSFSGQLEARWRLTKKWGAVAFAGGGTYTNSFSELREQDLIHSYGVGLRFMVQQSQRINVRVDYARSNGSNAVYLSVGESF